MNKNNKLYRETLCTKTDPNNESKWPKHFVKCWNRMTYGGGENDAENFEMEKEIPHV